MKKAKGQFSYIDGEVIRLLEDGPLSTAEIREALGISRDTWAIVRQRMAGNRQIRCLREEWDIYRPPATSDPSPFPKPWWPTPDVGLFG